ncbi:MAG: VWA domain-containing protein [Gammaproteobacteria bacterium]
MIAFGKSWLRMSGAAVLVACAATAQAEPIDLNVALGTPLLLAGQKQTAVVKVALTGFALKSENERTPANVALVIDRSGSMDGDKIEHAKEAAIMAIERLNANDIAAVVSYDDTVQVDVPATKVLDKAAFRHAIARIQVNGSTALFAGVSKGAKEVKKFLDRQRVNRVILISDGLANVGPSSPAELGRLGASLGEQGISVTTIGLGLGYNEDLMARLAGMSDGNHAFAENANDLAKIFDSEFGDVLSVVAQEVTIKIHCADGVRPLRVLGRDGDIAGQTVTLNLNQLYSSQEKFVLIEVEVPAGKTGESQAVADVDVAYFNTVTRQTDRLANKVAASFVASPEKVTLATDKKVMAQTVDQVANAISKEAVKLKDEGKVEEAQRKLQEGAKYLEQNAQQYAAPELGARSAEFKQDANDLSNNEDWNRKRKALVKRQYSIEKQQKY